MKASKSIDVSKDIVAAKSMMAASKAHDVSSKMSDTIQNQLISSLPAGEFGHMANLDNKNVSKSKDHADTEGNCDH